MPIKGVSDKARFPRLGKVRLGLRVEGGKNSYPKPVDYFVCPPEVQRVYGEKPKELKVMFPVEDETQWASQFYRCYSQTRGLLCKGDGERATALIDETTGTLAAHDAKNAILKEIPCDPEHCPYYGKQCRMVMNLQFLLPDVPGLGIWQLDTSSIISITNINDSIKFIRGICGRISLIPLTLALVPQQVRPNGKKKTVHVLTLTAPFTLSEIVRFASLPLKEALLPTPDAEVPEDLFPEQVLDEAKEEAADGQGAVEEEEPEPSPEEQVPPTESHRTPTPTEMPKDIKNWGDFASYIDKELSIKTSEVLARAGKKSWIGFADYEEAWQVVLEILKERDEGR